MTVCSECQKPEVLCLCRECRPLETQVSVLVLQHPQEPDQLLGTVPLIAKSLERSEIRVGLSWPNLRAALGREADPKRWGVLYLGSGLREGAQAMASHPELRDQTGVTGNGDRACLYVVNKSGVPLPDCTEVLEQLEGLVVLDGTWSQAKALWWRNPWLLKLRRLILVPAKKSLYGELRREPRRECLSTLESVAYSLEALAESSSIREELVGRFDALLQRYREHAPQLRTQTRPAGGGGAPRRRKRVR